MRRDDGVSTQPRTLADNLEQMLSSLDGNPVTVGQLLSAAGEQGLGVILVLVAIPAVVPLPFFHSPSGLSVLLIGLGLWKFNPLLIWLGWLLGGVVAAGLAAALWFGKALFGG